MQGGVCVIKTLRGQGGGLGLWATTIEILWVTRVTHKTQTL